MPDLEHCTPGDIATFDDDSPYRRSRRQSCTRTVAMTITAPRGRCVIFEPTNPYKGYDSGGEAVRAFVEQHHDE